MALVKEYEALKRREEIREGTAEKIWDWCRRNGYIVSSLNWEEVTGGYRGLILSITDIALEYEHSQGVVISKHGFYSDLMEPLIEE